MSVICKVALCLWRAWPLFGHAAAPAWRWPDGGGTLRVGVTGVSAVRRGSSPLYHPSDGAGRPAARRHAASLGAAGLCPQRVLPVKRVGAPTAARLRWCVRVVRLGRGRIPSEGRDRWASHPSPRALNAVAALLPRAWIAVAKGSERCRCAAAAAADEVGCKAAHTLDCSDCLLAAWSRGSWQCLPTAVPEDGPSAAIFAADLPQPSLVMLPLLSACVLLEFS